MEATQEEQFIDIYPSFRAGVVVEIGDVWMTLGRATTGFCRYSGSVSAG